MKICDGLSTTLAACVLLCFLAWTEPAVAEIRAAAGHRVVTPELGVYMAGYGHNRKAEGVLDPLFLKGVLLANEATSVLILTLDSIGLTRPEIRYITQQLQAADPKLRVLFSSTHTHAGPDVVGLWGPSIWSSGADPDYVALLVASAVDLHNSLRAALQPAQLSIGSKQHTQQWVENVSEPDLLDATLTVLRVANPAGETLATLTNFACHPTVLGPENTHLSADYVAGFYAAMSRHDAGEHLFLQGAIGGWVQPLQGDRSYERAQQLGIELAQEVIGMQPQMKAMQDSSLVFKEQEFDVPLDNWGFRLMLALGNLDRNLYGGWLGMEAMRTATAYLKIGELEMVSHPGETSPYFSHASRALLQAEHTMVLGLTQDALGYILKEAYFSDPDIPHASYLTSVSAGEQTGQRLMQAIRDNLANNN